tara:strand:+ start:15081 stop:15275 length:195 start_codon:yes stop_codon:yes gene_type:complete
VKPAQTAQIFNLNIQGYITMFTQKRFLMLFSLTILGLSLCACETMQGAGRDIERAGEAVQKAAK